MKKKEQTHLWIFDRRSKFSLILYTQPLICAIQILHVYRRRSLLAFWSPEKEKSKYYVYTLKFSCNTPQSCIGWGIGFSDTLIWESTFSAISLRLYVGWTRQLTHSHKYIIFEYFESGVAPPAVLNRRIFLTIFVSPPLFLFYC